VPRYLDAGYSFVDYDVSFGSYHVNQGNPLGARYARDVGMGMVAYLMEVPEEYYQEDQRALEERIKASEAGIKNQGRASGLDHGEVQSSYDK
jgi:hypothetical protein